MHVLVSDPIHEVGLELLREGGYTVELGYDLDDAALGEQLEGVHALIVRSATTVTEAHLDNAPELRIIARAGIGVDNVDIDAATERGIQVVNAPTGGVQAVAEHTLALAFALVRDLPATDRSTRVGAWPKAGYAGGELTGKTLGIIGLGRIGTAVAKRAMTLGLEVIAYDPFVAAGELEGLDVELAPLKVCLDRGDIVTIHTPLTDETRGMFDEGLLRHLEGGYLINCARGGIVDEVALAKLLAAGHLEGAALDVFEDEPLSADHPLCEQDRAILTPHIAGSSERAQRTIARSVASQVIAALEGASVDHPVNQPMTT